MAEGGGRAIPPEVAGELEAVLARARAQGFLGPGPSIAAHVDHALGFAAALAAVAPGQVPPEAGPALDLGSGGGLPGLVLALHWPASHWTLLDANERRTRALEEAVLALGLGDRVAVVRARAEEAGRDERWRGRFTVVVARSFGAPAVVAECASGFLAVGGHLVVSEPPAPDPGRWPVAGLERLGLVPVTSGDASFRCFRQEVATPDTYPRRVGRPGKQPLF